MGDGDERHGCRSGGRLDAPCSSASQHTLDRGAAGRDDGARPRSVSPACRPGWDRRALRGRGPARPWVPRRPGRDSGVLRRRSVRAVGISHVPDGRPGAVVGGRGPRLPGPDGRAGQDTGISRRPGGDRDRPAPDRGSRRGVRRVRRRSPARRRHDGARRTDGRSDPRDAPRARARVPGPGERGGRRADPSHGSGQGRPATPRGARGSTRGSRPPCPASRPRPTPRGAARGLRGRPRTRRHRSRHRLLRCGRALAHRAASRGAGERRARSRLDRS